MAKTHLKLATVRYVAADGTVLGERTLLWEQDAAKVRESMPKGTVYVDVSVSPNELTLATDL